ncbi:hypothetical protein N9L18_00325 [Candidatus Pacebacteria bacterium]|nr:hypothetical protein [Candidatus Paceibacterota bacterium]
MRKKVPIIFLGLVALVVILYISFYRTDSESAIDHRDSFCTQDKECKKDQHCYMKINQDIGNCIDNTF